MQLALFGGSAPSTYDEHFVNMVRRTMGGHAWIDYAPQWLHGHERLFMILEQQIRWRKTTQQLFEQTVATPRKTATFPDDGAPPAVIRDIAEALSARYDVKLDRISAALYADGRDSVAWHRDRVYRERPKAIVALLILGAPRPFLLRPYRAPRGADRSATPPIRRSVAFRPGWGDLLVMGGSTQRTWEHAVPKVRHADPRLSIMFRHDPGQL